MIHINDINHAIRVFMTENFLLEAPIDEVNDTESLAKRGILDSLGLVDLMQFVEHEFKIEIAHHEIRSDNFDTIRALCVLVASKLKRAA